MLLDFLRCGTTSLVVGGVESMSLVSVESDILRDGKRGVRHGTFEFGPTLSRPDRRC